MYSLRWSNRALKELASLPKKQAELIFAWASKNLDGCENPRAVLGGKILAGTKSGWRYRVGAYRLLCEIRDTELIVRIVCVGHRQGVYSNIPKP